MIGVGDLVVCVDNGPRPHSAQPEYLTRLRVGATYTVDGILPNDDPGIWIAEVPTLCAFHADRFRKIEHDKREACEAEFVTLLNRTKVEGMIPTFQAWSDDLDRLMLDHGDYRRRLGDAADRAARAASLRPQPASPFSQSGIPIAGWLPTLEDGSCDHEWTSGGEGAWPICAHCGERAPDDYGDPCYEDDQ